MADFLTDNWFTDLLIDWLTDLLTDPLTDCWSLTNLQLSDELTGLLADWLLMVWLVNWLVVDWPTDRMIDWLASLMTEWLSGWLPARMNDLLTDLPIG